jgi:hypothetical protein
MDAKLKSAVESSRVTYESAIYRLIPRGLDARDEGERALRRWTAMRQWDKMGNAAIIAGPFFSSRAMRRS